MWSVEGFRSTRRSSGAADERLESRCTDLSISSRNCDSMSNRLAFCESDDDGLAGRRLLAGAWCFERPLRTTAQIRKATSAKPNRISMTPIVPHCVPGMFEVPGTAPRAAGHSRGGA